MHLWDALTRDQHGRGTLQCWTGESFEAAGWADVVADARRIAGGLRRLGVGRGSRVASVLSNSREAVRGVLAVWLAGGTLASLPVPARGMDTDEYRDQLRALIARMEPAVLAIDAELHALEPVPAGDVRAAAWQSLASAPPLDPDPPPIDDVAFIQYSSGSTETPKGCMLTGRAIAAQLEIVRAMSDGVPGAETVCSWLPLSHDMGLFGNLLYAWAWDHDLILSSPERFMLAPRTWFEDMARCGCTQSAGTGSALHFATRAQRAARLPGPLRLRTLVIGAERVEAGVLDEALATFGAAGLHPSALRPAYGLAEATLAVTATPTDAPPRVRAVDSAALADGELREARADGADATTLVSLGPPCDGVELRFPHATRVSELHVRTPSMFSGYYADPGRTRERLRDGELATRDLGFLHDGELYLVGRTDDVLSVAGRNVYTSEIEAAVSALDGVRRGCCTIVDLPGRTPRLALLAELRDGHGESDAIAAAAARIATAKAGVRLSECVFLKKGTLPKTPTGKIQRFRCRDLLLRDELPVVAAWRAPRANRALTTYAPARRRRTIVVTGASGVVGKALLPELADHELICLVNRGKLEDGHTVVRADVTQPRLGLDRVGYAELVRRADCVIHSAAVTDWAAPAERIRAANVEGTRNVLELASAAGAPLYFLSSAFVAAIRPDAPLALPPDHIVVDYVTSKRDAERLVRDSGLPATILRPTNLIGDSRTGAIARNQIVRQVIGLVCLGLVPLFPTRRETLLDVIPQDVFAQAVAGLVRDGEAGGEYWLAYGEQAFTVVRALELCADFMDGIGRAIDPPRIVDPDALDADRDAIEALAPAARAVFARLLEFGDGLTACDVFPSDMDALAERYGLDRPSLEDAYVRGLAHWARKRGLDDARTPIRSA